MANVLYIKASPRGERSYSIRAAEAFLDAYRQKNPDDQVTTVDVFEDDLPAFDFKAASAKYKIMHGQEHTENDRKTWDAVVSVIDKFKAADKYVLATPMWNFSIPYRLKQYIDIIVQPGLTFTITEDGQSQGLVGDKPIFIAYARGGAYPPGSGREGFDFQKPYLEMILQYSGLTDIRALAVEPTLMAGPEAAAESQAEAIAKAREMAAAF
jgi:FMN-dependent NADH-azoreductase